MEGRFFVLSLLFGAVSVMADGSCQNPKERWECGWLGIDQQTCEARGCCWDPSDPNKPWCYVKPGTYLPDGLCPVAPSERQECGYFGIDKEECLGRSCCWDPIVPNTNWCFTQPSEPSMGCYLPYGVSGTCKYVCDPGEDKMYGMPDCEGRICCYNGFGK